MPKLYEPGFLNYLSRFDICCLTETFAAPNLDITKHLPDFETLQSPGIKLSTHGRRSGGVMMLVRKHLMSRCTLLDTECDTMLALRIQNRSLDDTIIICAYIPPIDSPYYCDKNMSSNLVVLEEVLLRFQEKYPGSDFLICGDMNARIASWDTQSEEAEYEDDWYDQGGTFCTCDNYLSPRRSQDRTVNNFGKLLMNLCKVHHALVLNGCTRSDRTGQYTYLSPTGDSVIDYCLVITQYLPYDVDLRVDARVESHHMPLVLTYGSPTRRLSSTSPRSYFKLCWDASKAEDLKKHIDSQSFDNQIALATAAIDSSIDAAVAMFTETLTKSAECMRKEVKIFDQTNPKPRSFWFDTECRDSKQAARTALKLFKKYRTPDLKENYNQARRQYKKLIKEKKCTHYSNQRTTLVNSLNDSGAFWSMIKRLTRRSTPLPNIDMEAWKKHFETVFGTKNSSGSVDSGRGEVITHDTLDKEISREEVRSAINKLKSSKAPGLDGLPGGCLKVTGDKVVPFLTKLFNEMFSTHCFPKIWSRSIVIPLHKKGDTLKPENYRGISLLSAVAKIFTSVLTRRLRHWMETEKKICCEQAGFRSKHSTIDHIYTLYSIVLKHVYGDRRGKIFVAFVDFSKAFDSVNRDKLWKVLRNARLSTKFCQMLKAMYSDVEACVRWGEELSDYIKCPIGVKQGANESPFLFSLYIDTVAEYIRRKGKHGIQMMPNMTEVFLLLFADDVVLLSTTPTGLQNQLNNLDHISKALDLKVNTDKTKVMVFRRGGHLAFGERWYLDGKQLEVVNQYKYLGFVFTTRLSIQSTLDDIAIRGKQKGVHILRALWRVRSTNTKVFTNLFDTQVLATLMYGSEIWGLQKCHKIERTHTFVCKKFMGLDTRTPNHMVYGDLGRFPTTINSSVRAIKYWLKLCKMGWERLPKQAYLMLLNTNINDSRNWTTAVRNHLFQLGFGFVWLNGGVGNEKRFVSVLKQRMKDCYMQDWNAENKRSDRYNWYSLFKTQLGLEKYLNSLDIKKFRDALIRFRLGINDLPVNRRFGQLQDQNCLCPFCQTQEDEVHFLCHCTAYCDLRKKYLGHRLFSRSNPYKCYSIMQETVDKKIRSLAMYVYYAFERRKNILSS